MGYRKDTMFKILSSSPALERTGGESGMRRCALVFTAALPSLASLPGAEDTAKAGGGQLPGAGNLAKSGHSPPRAHKIGISTVVNFLDSVRL